MARAALIGFRACGALARCASTFVQPAHLLASTSYQDHQHLRHLPAEPAASFSGRHSFAHYGVAAVQAVQHEIEPYRIKVVTGNLRGAGTRSAALIQLIGSNGASEKYQLGVEDPGGFDRGSERTFVVPVPKDIGQLRRVLIEKRRDSLIEFGEGWYLKHVEVQSPSGEQLLFPCNSWLGESDSGDIVGPIERNLLPAVHEKPVEAHEPVTVNVSGLAIPHPQKVKESGTKGVNKRGFGFGGEDAYFYCMGRNNVFGMGVADGIYEWRTVGIDSGHMAQTLMETAKHMVGAGIEDVFKVLQASARHVECEGVHGSATVCILTINTSNGQLHSANLGDSGFIVFGPGKEGAMELKYRTNQLEHEFGRPYQIGHHKNADHVEDSELASFHVRKGDVIVMGTDGLLDNLAEMDMMYEVSKLQAANAPAAAYVQRLTKLAFDASMDKKRVTPYSKGASEAFDMVYNGGKPDDITVLVAICS